MCCPGGNSDFYLISLSAVKKTGLCKWQNQIEFIFTALESMGFIVSSGLISHSSSSFFLLSLLFLLFSFSCLFFLILPSDFIIQQFIGKVDQKEKHSLFVGYFPCVPPSKQLAFIYPASCPRRLACMDSFLQVPLPSGFLGLASERPQQNERDVPIALACPSHPSTKGHDSCQACLLP